MDVFKAIATQCTHCISSVTSEPSSTDCLAFPAPGSNVQDSSYNTSMDRGRPDLHKSVPSVRFDHSCSCCKGIFGRLFSTLSHGISQYKMAAACALTDFKQFLLKSLSITFLNRPR